MDHPNFAPEVPSLVADVHRFSGDESEKGLLVVEVTLW